MVVVYRTLLIVALTISCTSYLFAQFDKDYLVRKSFKNDTDSLFKVLKEIEKAELKILSSSEQKVIGPIYKKASKKLRQLVKEGLIINDRQIQGFVDKTYTSLNANNKFKRPAHQILISNDPHVNAISYVQGTIVINIGLLNQVESEDQLAFILAHEQAHFDLNHVKQWASGNRPSQAKEARKELEAVLGGGGSKEGYNSLLNWLEEVTSISQEFELQADSLAFIYMSKSKFNLRAAVSVFGILDTPYSPKVDYGFKWLTTLESGRFKLNPDWFKDLPNIYKQYSAHKIASLSKTLDTHPKIVERINGIRPLLAAIEPNNDLLDPSPNVEEVIRRCEFEWVEGARKNRMLDLSLFQSLQLYQTYPKNSYIIINIARVLYAIYNAKLEGTLNHLVPILTPNYSPELKVVNNMLYNMKEGDIAEMGYNFMMKQRVYTSPNQDIIAWAWQFTKLTNRGTQKKEIAKVYNNRFKSSVAKYNFLK